MDSSEWDPCCRSALVQSAWDVAIQEGLPELVGLCKQLAVSAGRGRAHDGAEREGHAVRAQVVQQEGIEDGRVAKVRQVEAQRGACVYDSSTTFMPTLTRQVSALRSLVLHAVSDAALVIHILQTSS